MMIRFVKGQARPESPRLKDNRIAPTARERSVDHAADGRFAPDNGAANGRAAKSLIRDSLGGDGSDPELVRDALVMYRAIIRTMPSDGPSTRQLTASRCRHVVLATRFANEAARVGLTTPKGMKLAEASRSHDLAAQRLAVTAYDLSLREEAAKPKGLWDPLGEFRSAPRKLPPTAPTPPVEDPLRPYQGPEDKS